MNSPNDPGKVSSEDPEAFNKPDSPDTSEQPFLLTNKDDAKLHPLS